MTHAPGSAAWERNANLLKARVESELLTGRDYVKARLHDAFPGLIGRMVAPLAAKLWQHIGEAEVRRRVGAHVDVVLAAAADAARAEPEKAVAAWLPRALGTEELVHRANRDHACFPQLAALVEEAFRQRVHAITRFLSEGDGEDYPDAVRTAFPEHAALEALVARHLDLGRDTLDLVAAHPGLLRFPAPLRSPLLRLAQNVLAWYRERVLTHVRNIYDGS